VSDANILYIAQLLFCTLIVASFFTLIDGDIALC